jgi:alkylhydroperoxidase/carboxymuconolactone decarboxylase family protein YurZ
MKQMKHKKDARATLQALSEGDLTLVNTLLRMTEGSLEESGLDPQSHMLVRLAALATLDAAPASWLINMRVSGEAGLAPEQLLGTLVAIAPVIGTARVVSAATSIVQALELANNLSASTP